MKVLLDEHGGENPFAPHPHTTAPQGQASARAYSGDYYGAFSLEKFCDVGGLSYTHEDAQGWLAYPTKFNPANFWYKDENVLPWAYYEDYDNWEDTYGVDAVNAVYHSGHGGMDGAGKFYLPVGGNWGGLGCTVTSDRMRVGNEQANYIFLSTCLSLRVLDGHTPVRTWGAANLGFRMLFGYESVSWDSPDYGKFFWEEWNKGQAFGSAWLNAGWRVAHDQSPSVVACGADAAEASNRLNTERSFQWGHASANWWQWRWYTAARTREANFALPKELLVARLAPPATGAGAVQGTLNRLGVDIETPDAVAVAGDGSYTLRGKETRITFGRDGRFTASLAAPNHDNRVALPQRRAITLAEEGVRRYGLDADVSLTFDRLRLLNEAGGANDGSGQRVGPFAVETTAQFRQLINGLPVLTPDAGVVQVSLDNDGAVTSVHSSTRTISGLSDRPRNGTATPSGDGPAARARAADPASYERLLGAAWSERVATWALRGRMPEQFSVVPGSTEVGYDIRGDEAVLIARRAVEVDFGDGYRKRYWVNVDLLA